MRAKSEYIKADSNSLWKWKGSNFNKKSDENQFPVAKFLRESRRKAEETVLGPGGGAGIGCGVGLGFGLVGGAGFGGWSWNYLHLAFGVGLGCGAGFGLGFGQGIGYGFSIDSLQSHLSEQKSDSKDRSRMLIQI